MDCPRGAYPYYKILKMLGRYAEKLPKKRPILYFNAFAGYCYDEEINAIRKIRITCYPLSPCYVDKGPVVMTESIVCSKAYERFKPLFESGKLDVKIDLKEINLDVLEQLADALADIVMELEPLPELYEKVLEKSKKPQCKALFFVSRFIRNYKEELRKMRKRK